MEYLGAWGTLIHGKNLKSKISCQIPFNYRQLAISGFQYNIFRWHWHKEKNLRNAWAWKLGHKLPFRPPRPSPCSAGWSFVPKPAADTYSSFGALFLNIVSCGKLPPKYTVPLQHRFLTPVAKTNGWFSLATRPLMPADDMPCFRSVHPLRMYHDIYFRWKW